MGSPRVDKVPETYRGVIEEFLVAYYDRRKWELEQAFLEVRVPLVPPDLLFKSALADQLAEIGRAAAGEVRHSKDGDIEAVVRAGLQDLVERLFLSPVMGTCEVPAAFWDTSLGRMVAQAWIWVERGELITVAEAARLRGVTTQAISNAVREGRVTRYVDPDAPQHQGRTLVSRKEVEAM